MHTKHDLMVHLDDDGDPVLEGLTPKGVEYCLSLRGGIPSENSLVIGVSPEEFMDLVPRELTVGFQNPNTGTTQNLRRPLLH